MFPYCFQEAPNPSQVSQMLNDQGALFIQQGELGRAIEHLVKALKIYEGVADVVEACSCNHCRFDSCISSSRQAKRFSFPACCQKALSADHQSPPPSDDCRSCPCDDGGYVYRQPIFCPPTFSQAGHYPGVTLLVIIIFNLALAHHLLSISKYHECQPRGRRQTLSKALQLYELFYQLLMEREIFSTQAMLAVANNVGEIHRIVGNHSKHIVCLEHLMSCIMLVVEDHQSSGSASSTSDSPTTPGSGAPMRMSCHTEEMEGFLRNASQLVLNDNCASAA